MFWQSSQAQALTYSFSSKEVDAGQFADVDVTVSNFVELFGFQASIVWDSTKFRFVSIENRAVETVLPGDFDLGGTPDGDKRPQGQLTMVWVVGTPTTIANNTRLFTLRLRAVGKVCDSTNIDISDKPLSSEYYKIEGSDFKTLKPQALPGKVKIKGPNCGTTVIGNTDSTLLAINIGTVSGKKGETVCVPVTVKNFKDVAAVQALMSWDPAVLKLKLPVVTTFPAPAPLFNEGQVNLGSINFLWQENTTKGYNIPDGGKMLDLCFEILGNTGTTSIVSMDTSTLNTGFTESSSKEKKFVVNNGRVNVVDASPIIINIAKVTGNANGTVDVDFKVENFNKVQGATFAMTYDGTILRYDTLVNDAVVASSAKIGTNRVNFNFVSQNASGITLSNGATMFTARFTALACSGDDKVSAIEVKDQSNQIVEFIVVPQTKSAVTVNQGSATIKCSTGGNPCNIAITSSTNVQCKGGSDGAINVSITNTTGTCQAQWKKNGVNFGTAQPLSNANLTGLGAGTYLLEVSCGGTVQCTATAAISEPANGVTIGETITNIGCGTATGAISLNISGGTPGTGYRFAWSNNATTKDLAGISAGNYTVTVTDANNCTSSKTFTITSTSSSDLTATATKVDLKCNKSTDGSINLSIMGGCPTYKIVWAGSTETGSSRTGLAAGVYNVTITDGSSPAKSTNLAVTIVAPSEITVNGTVTPSTGANGGIVVTASGGTGAYTYNWGSNITTKDRSNLAVGSYTVTVSDANGCTAVKSFEVLSSGAALNLGAITVPSANQFNGFGVSCVNLCDGELAGTLAGGTAPYTVALSGVSTASQTLAAAGTFSFKGLCVGNYTIRVTDASGASASKTSVISSPTVINISEQVTCANGAIPTGAVNITVTGGVQPYKYAWSNNKATEDLELLTQGTYSVVISDANGCQSIAKAFAVKDCNSSDDCFTDYTTIFTPNTDGTNDAFLIACAPTFENELFVYDRWGKLVYTTKNYTNLWDGKDLSGSDLPEGGYMWALNVRYSDGSRQTFKGAVTLLR